MHTYSVRKKENSITAMNCAALHCTVLYCTVLYCTYLISQESYVRFMHYLAHCECVVELD
jgi:hypothetical protein